MADRWIVTPLFFELPEPALIGAAPPDAHINAPELVRRSPPELAIAHGGIRRFVEEALGDGHRPVSLAGDCCAALPVLAGLQRAGIDPDLLWIDAHGDFNTPETSPSQFLGGMPLAMIAGRGPQWMMEGAKAGPIPEERILLAGARDLDPLEAEALDASAVTRIALPELAEIAFDGPVMLHLDVDVLDLVDAPAMRYPSAGGPPLDRVVAALADLAARADIAAVSVSGWAGHLDRDGRTARAVARLLETLAR